MLFEARTPKLFEHLVRLRSPTFQQAEWHEQSSGDKTINYDCSAAGSAGFAECNGAKSALKASRLLFLLASKEKKPNKKIKRDMSNLFVDRRARINA